MDLQHGILLCLLHLIGTFIIFSIIIKAEQPKEKKEEDNPIHDYWKDFGR
jgi:hypothetical protein